MARPGDDTPRAAATPSLIDMALSGGVPKRSLLVAVVVGTILNLINQGDALFADGPVDYYKLGLTYIVPYCVATYGAVMAKRDALKKEGRNHQ